MVVRKEGVRNTRNITNMAWGMWKMARIGSLKRMTYLLKAIVKSSCLYRVEIWVCGRREEIERV
ncbi:hypothetical protein TSAR_003879 [Trichomalopsis sarcophagae]|uniref:Uncharacterized protein n=1 Tax=Trichomalopsis sarcophagae TaxID=543379 RepID=A0A232F447_9HYME|nr:hypothetical protein TSAR_003879 [Trichomalopsis sarcophagae]